MQNIENGRRMSYSSAALAMGNMPEEVKMNDPTINVFFFFKNGQCPSEHELLPIIKKLINFSNRLSGIPSRKVGCANIWHFERVQNLQPKQMVREVEVNVDTMEEMAEVLQEQRNVILRDITRNLPWWEFVIISNTNGRSENVLCLRVDHAIGDGFSVGNICSRFIMDETGALLEDFVPEKMRLNKENAFHGQSRFGIFCRSMLSLLKLGVLPLSAYDSKNMFSKNMARKDKASFSNDH